MKIMLLFPPNWTPSMPHLALPTLAAYLRERGIEVIQRDLNAEVFDEILTREYLSQTIGRLRSDYRPESIDQASLGPMPPHSELLWAQRSGPQLAAEVEQAKAVLRSEQFFEGATGKRAFQVILQSLELASLPFYPASLQLQSYVSAMPVDGSSTLLEAVQSERFNIFLEIYRRGIIEDITREDPDIVGISIPSMPQMLAGMTLGSLIKRAGLPCHVTVGGPHISMLREQIPKTPALFQLFDSAVVFDGEEPLLRLAEAVDGGGDLSTVPNLIYVDGSAIKVTERKAPEKIADVPLPDFDGLPLDRYLAPALVLPLLTARGCYFGKCAFCNVGYGESESFSQLRAGQLADQMLTLQQKYGARHIFFADEAVTPRNLRDLSPLLTERGSPLQWGGCVRFEKVISGELLQSMSAGGCRMILFGLESASQSVMDLMVKGTEVDHMSRILKESSSAGIWNHTFFFFGFPGETLENAQDTVNFLYAHKDGVHSAAMGTFLMERYSPAHRYPGAFGVKRVIEEPEKDLAIYFDYEVESGMDAEMAELVSSRFMDTLPVKRSPQYYVNDVYRFLYACHMADRGQPMPPWLVPEEAFTPQ